MLVTIEFDSISTRGKIEIIRVLTDCNILAKIAKYENPEIREEVARNENTGVDTLRRLAEDSDIDVLMSVARNKNTPADILDKLADYDFYGVQEEVACNLNTSSDTLEKLVNLGNSLDVVRLVARNVNISPKLRTELSKHYDWEVRNAVASL